ncbi:MAG: MlaD family protein [Verrucomicrobiota bacterium]
MSSARKVGLFVLFTLALIAAMILNFSKGRGLFTSTYTIRIATSEVGGLKEGAPVSISGVPVGSVSRIELTPDRKIVEISAKILSRYPVRRDARFSIDQSGFLGDQYVSITPQGATAPVISDNEIVQAEKPFDLQETARSATALLGKLDIALDRINGAVRKVDEQLITTETLTNLTASAANLRRATEEAAATLEDARRLVQTNAPAVSGVLSNLTAMTGTLKGTALQLDGLVTEERPALKELVSNADAATADLKSITADLRSGRGVAGALLQDEALRLQMGSALTNLATVSSNLARFGIFYKPRQPRPPSSATNRVVRLGKDHTEDGR